MLLAKGHCWLCCIVLPLRCGLTHCTGCVLCLSLSLTIHYSPRLFHTHSFTFYLRYYLPDTQTWLLFLILTGHWSSIAILFVLQLDCFWADTFAYAYAPRIPRVEYRYTSTFTITSIPVTTLGQTKKPKGKIVGTVTLITPDLCVLDFIKKALVQS
jgi:hypothetical protein